MSRIADSGICTTEAKLKLTNLEAYLPKISNEFITEFAKHLAWRLNGQITPFGFITVYEKTLQELQNGTYFNNLLDDHLPLNKDSMIVGNGPGFYLALRARMGIIAETIFPKEFADAVKAEFETMNSQASS
jgi:hypothetical protein